MKSLFDPHITKIIETANKLWDDDMALVFLTGGLTTNAYVLECLKNNFKYYDVTVHRPKRDWRQGPVARGSILVEPMLDQSKLPSRMNTGIVNARETYNPDDHEDASHPDPYGPDDGEENPLVFRERVYEEEFSWKDSLYVEDRIQWMIEQVSDIREITKV
jgi:hypothetical protein